MAQRGLQAPSKGFFVAPFIIVCVCDRSDSRTISIDVIRQTCPREEKEEASHGETLKLKITELY